MAVRGSEPGAEHCSPGMDANRHRVVIVLTGSRFRSWDEGWHKREKYSCNPEDLVELPGLKVIGSSE